MQVIIVSKYDIRAVHKQITKNDGGIRLFEARQIPEVRCLSVFVAGILLIAFRATSMCRSQYIYRLHYG